MSGPIALIPNRRQRDRVSSMLAVTPLTDLMENADGYILYCNVPGAEQSGVEVCVHNDVLRLRAESVLEPVTGKVHAFEICDIVYEARFQLSPVIDANRVEATLSNGVLSVQMPFSQKKQSVRIPVLKG